ncbi:hypothetical protein NE865_06494 [Phthorimaea operculella]|nr:hypothetical protein NE865_06494 [Phthorimaea operculella]
MSKRSAEDEIARYERKIRKLRESADGGRRSVTTAEVHPEPVRNPPAEVRNPRVEIRNPPAIVRDPPAEVRDPPAEVHDSPARVHNPPIVAEPDAMAASGPSELVPGPVLENGTLESGDISSAQIPEGPEVQTQAGNDPEPELDPELLEALGESTCDTPEYGPKIHENLANLWLPLLRKGMSKDNKEKMLKEYLIPDNCRLLQSPKLNPEISAAVPDLARNRDKGLMSQQQQLGSGITAVNRTLDLLLKGDSKKEAIQHLSNACRILSDLHAVFTKNRIKLITSNLDKNFLHVIQDSERDETLFGTKLSDKIKAAKAIERQGQQIRKSNPPRASNASHSGTSRASFSGNWSAPPRYQANRGGRGGPRKSGPQTHRQYGHSNQLPPATKPQTTVSKPRAPTTQ